MARNARPRRPDPVVAPMTGSTTVSAFMRRRAFLVALSRLFERAAASDSLRRDCQGFI